MNKLCCCVEPELPDISVSVNCACCESRVQERKAKDVTDLTTSEMDITKANEKNKEEISTDEDDKAKEETDTTCCCCFRRKRHAKPKKNKNRSSHHGTKT